MSNQKQRFRAVAFIVLGAAAALIGVEAAGARQVLVPRPEDTRFQLIASEPIAGPDGRSHVPGWSVVVLRDRRADRCYVVFKREDSISVEPAGPCAN